MSVDGQSPSVQSPREEAVVAKVAIVNQVYCDSGYAFQCAQRPYVHDLACDEL